MDERSEYRDLPVKITFPFDGEGQNYQPPFPGEAQKPEGTPARKPIKPTDISGVTAALGAISKGHIRLKKGRF